MEPNCEKCELWNRAAIKNGYQSGMCGDCYNKYYVSIDLPYKPKKKINVTKLGKKAYEKWKKCKE